MAMTTRAPRAENMSAAAVAITGRIDPRGRRGAPAPSVAQTASAKPRSTASTGIAGRTLSRRREAYQPPENRTGTG